MIDEKYIVFKRKDFMDILDSFGDANNVKEIWLPPALDDAVVIRTQDVFAAPALEAYAHTVSVVVQASVMSVRAPDTQENQGLLNVADYMQSRAVEAWQRQDKKLPD